VAFALPSENPKWAAGIQRRDPSRDMDFRPRADAGRFSFDRFIPQHLTRFAENIDVFPRDLDEANYAINGS
jgi:hypothetical protein